MSGYGVAPVTADEVRRIAFDRAPLVARGYDEEEVDGFLDRAVEALTAREAGRSAGLSGTDVRSVMFRKPPPGRRGYHPDQVDEFLDRLAFTLSEQPGESPEPYPRDPRPQDSPPQQFDPWAETPGPVQQEHRTLWQRLRGD